MGHVSRVELFKRVQGNPYSRHCRSGGNGDSHLRYATFMKFNLTSQFKPAGDQPRAIKELVQGLKKNHHDQTLLGVTGSGKTFTMANVINQVQKPTLVISHNKTLAAQLATEFKGFFPDNAVHYFVSYYDYYQPEAYMPRTDTYIEKETDINDEIDRLRNAATASLLSRQDVIIVASVSCIYGLGSPETYNRSRIGLEVGQVIDRPKLLRQLVDLRYNRSLDLKRGTFRVTGELIEIYPSYWAKEIIKVHLFGDEIEKIQVIDPLTQEGLEQIKDIIIFPATHYIAPQNVIDIGILEIKEDLKIRSKELLKKKKLLESQRLEQRVKYDMEMIEQTGYCTGIENYSRYFDRRQPGQPPYTLIDYFPEDFLMFIDESHITAPQIRGMYEGDRARKETLVNFGFRLPSCLDNRPLNFKEFEKKINQVIYTSATPAEYELKKSKQIAEQIIRPTALLDPTVDVRPTKNQIDDLLNEIQKTIKKKQRVLITTLTKRLSEELSDYLKDFDIKVHYLHSEITTFKRLEILRDFRLGVYDVVVGINLLREGLDLPEVSLIAILDADKEGFLRTDTALIQTMGRASRHVEGRVIMYADRISRSMKKAIDETKRRRQIQEVHNKKHKITPKTIKKVIVDSRLAGVKAVEKAVSLFDAEKVPKDEIRRLIQDLANQMDLAAKNLEFEKAAVLRDQIKELRQIKK